MKRLRLYMRPRPAPKWWPRKGNRPQWVGVLRGGDGWVVGDGDLLTPTQLRAARWMMRRDQHNPEFEIRG